MDIQIERPKVVEGALTVRELRKILGDADPNSVVLLSDHGKFTPLGGTHKQMDVGVFEHNGKVIVDVERSSEEPPSAISGALVFKSGRIQLESRGRNVDSEKGSRKHKRKKEKKHKSKHKHKKDRGGDPKPPERATTIHG